MSTAAIDALAASPPSLMVDNLTGLFEAQLQHQFIVARTTAKERISKLQGLHDAVIRYRADIKAAMWADFRKGGYETDITELAVVTGEIRHAIRHLRRWMRPKG